jgi:anaerobic magnesium-protoporphyrin IX monomethyl ester cyclase
MSSKLDVLFISPGNHKAIYQDLEKDYSAIETPTWALLLAQSLRAAGFKPGIFDVNAERLSTRQSVQRVIETDTRLLCFVVYGQNPNSGTVNMSGATALAKAIKEEGITTPICFVGSHVSALPIEVLKNESCVDLVLCNEGVYALRNLLKSDIEDTKGLAQIKGIGYRKNGRPVLTTPEQIVPQERMDIDLPGYAWDLLPYDKKPLDLYRAHFWHAEYDHKKRTPFAAIYTSLGCTFKCDFCMINILNRNDQAPIGVASNYSKMRFWSPEFIIKEFDKLVDMGVRTLRISDEMFLLNKKYYVPLCEKIIERGYGDKLSMWAYSRIDTVRDPKQLELIRKAGIKWLALGIESSEKIIRLASTKGKFEDLDISDVVKKVHEADIEIIANYLFGLTGDTFETMQKTLDLSLELNTIAWNAYAVMPFPGSALYKRAVDTGLKLPDDYAGYSYHSYNTQPLPTDQVTAAEILKFRDAAFSKYHTHKPFLEKIRSKYGKSAVKNIEDMTKIKLKRKICGD